MARNVRKFHFGLCLRATVITDRSLTLTLSDAVVDESDQGSFPSYEYLLGRLIQRAVKGYRSEKMMLDTERAILVICTYTCD